MFDALFALFQTGFEHGIHPDPLKARTAGLPTQRMAFVERYVLPLHQHLGAPSRPIVAAGERVARGQMIAEPGGVVSAALAALFDVIREGNAALDAKGLSSEEALALRELLKK